MDPEYEPKDWKEALAHAMEEMGEAIQACGKTLRFGLTNYHPHVPEEERELNCHMVSREFTDVRNAMKRAELMMFDAVQEQALHDLLVSCEKCGKERYPQEYEGVDDFMIAIDADDGKEKLMCPECVAVQGGSGFEYPEAQR